MFSSRTGWRLYALVCFGFCIWWTFPADLLLQRLVLAATQETGVRVRYAEGDWTWWEGWVLRDLTVESPIPRLTTMQLSRLTLRPSLLAFLRRPPLPLTFSADLYGGALAGIVRQSATGIDTQLTLRQLALAQWPLPPPWGQGGISGSLTADGALQGDPADLQSMQGTFSVTLTDGGLRAGTVAKLPRLTLQTIQAHLRATLAGERLEITACNLKADGVEAQVQGRVMLRAPLGLSGLDLQLTASIAEGTPPSALTALISFLPAASPTRGERHVSITGSLAAPVVKKRD